MEVTRRCFAVFMLACHLFCIHFGLMRLWYGGGMRQAFTLRQNQHVQDLLLAIELARAGVPDNSGASAHPLPARERPRLALLFMLRRQLQHFDIWSAWLEPERARPGGPRLSLYYHLADGAHPTVVTELMALPGSRQVVETVKTGWCELVAAQVALIRAALADDLDAGLFVFLPHDALPLAPLERTLGSLTGPEPVRTRVCFSGVRGLDVPEACSHAIEPHWSRSLLLKHHQWLALSRSHAERVVDVRALGAAFALFQEWFLGEPLCSDEVILILAVALPDELLTFGETVVNGSLGHATPPLSRLPLYSGASQGLGAFAQELQALDISSECITYAPWPGCHAGVVGGKRATSPVPGAGLLPEERDSFLEGLASAGVLFVRKVQVNGGIEAATAYLAFLDRASVLPPPAPPRLLPDGSSNWWRKLLWALATLEASASILKQVTAAMVLGAVTFWALIGPGQLGRIWLQRFLMVFVFGHAVAFFCSVAFFSNYSLFEPLRRAGVTVRDEF